MPDSATAQREPLLFAHINGFSGRSYLSFLAPPEFSLDVHLAASGDWLL